MLEACRGRSRVHPPAPTCMAACWAHHQRPSVGTGSPGRTALPPSRACSGIEAMTCLATPPAEGGRQVPHRVLHEELLGDSSDPCCVLCDLVQQSKGLWARATVRLVTQRYKAAGAGAGAAVCVPLECIFGFRGRPCRPCRRRNS